MNEPLEPAGLTMMRRLLLMLLMVAMVGTAADLVLLDHFESVWQIVPLAVIALGIASALAAAAHQGARTLTLMRLAMALFIGAGLIGIGLHYAGNNEFQRELDPDLRGWTLFVKSVTSKAPPALAPAGMIQMGLLGLLYTYQHPALRHPLQHAGLDR
jgi:hypothetical protein